MKISTIILSVLIISGILFVLLLFTPDFKNINQSVNSIPLGIPPTITNITSIPLTPNLLTNNLSIICVSGYSSTVRDVPQSLRLKIFARDNVSYPQPEGTTELDHITPLCLGGSNDESNLFVQFAPEYKLKDKLENYLCHKVCELEIDINEAQTKIATNWSKYYEEIYGNRTS